MRGNFPSAFKVLIELENGKAQWVGTKTPKKLNNFQFASTCLHSVHAKSAGEAQLLAEEEHAQE